MASQSTTLADAEAYLQAYGLPDGLAQLPVKLGGASLSPGEQVRFIGILNIRLLYHIALCIRL